MYVGYDASIEKNPFVEVQFFTTKFVIFNASIFAKLKI